VFLVTFQEYLITQFRALATQAGVENLEIFTPDELPDVGDKAIYIVDEAEGCIEDFGLTYGPNRTLGGMRIVANAKKAFYLSATFSDSCKRILTAIHKVKPAHIFSYDS
jgi:hypothetical protein